MPPRTAPLDRLRPVRVEADGVAVDHLAQVVAFEPDRRRCERRLRTRCAWHSPVRPADAGELLADRDRVTLADRERVDHAGDGGDQLVVHLHRLDERQDVAGAHRRPDLDEHRHDGSLQLGGHADVVGHGPGLVSWPGRASVGTW